MTHALVQRYGDPLALLGQTPRTTTDLYREWARVPIEKSLNRRERNERRWLGQTLERLSRKGVIYRDIIDGERVAFARQDVEPAHAAGDQSGLPHQDGEVRRVGGVGQSRH